MYPCYNYIMERFLTAQEDTYEEALAEIRTGRKTGHWMWFIFPQLKGLGTSEMSEYYGITNLAEAKAYLDHEILGQRLREATRAVLWLDIEVIDEFFGDPDCVKLFSCMTLFYQASEGEELFMRVLKRFYNGQQDRNTLRLLKVGA